MKNMFYICLFVYLVCNFSFILRMFVDFVLFLFSFSLFIAAVILLSDMLFLFFITAKGSFFFSICQI